MAAQFAGSRSLDERRRRRLAQESVDDARTLQNRPQVATTQPNRSEPTTASTLQSDVVASESLVPAQLWKVLLVGIIGLGTWAGMTLINGMQMSVAGLEQVLAPKTGTAFTLFSALCLIQASQLSFVIYWYRSRSRKDFSGRYRIWAWSGALWLLTALVVGLRVHQPLAALAYQSWPIHCWRPEVLYWFVPFAIGALAVHQLLSLDLRHSRLSHAMWTLTLGLAVTAAGLQFGLDHWLPASMRELSLAATSSLWHFFICWSLLVHARFVVHVTNEAAPRRRNRAVKLATSLVEKAIAIVHSLIRRFSRDPEKKRQRQADQQQRKAERREAVRKRKEAQQAAKNLQATQRRETREQRKKERQEQRQLAQMAKQEAAEQRQAAKASKKAEKAKSVPPTSESAAAQPKPSPDSESPATPEQKSTAKTKTSTPQSTSSHKTHSGKTIRVDNAHNTPAPHAADSIDDTPQIRDTEFDDFEDETDVDYSRMSKKQRRKARKKRRQSRTG